MSANPYKHLLDGAKEREEQANAKASATAILAAVEKAQKPARVPKPKGLAAKIVTAGRKARGQ